MADEQAGPAHIVNHEGHEVGDKVLAICGEKWKVTMLWPDIPDDHPICRDCVEVAIQVMDETAQRNYDSLSELIRMRSRVDALARILTDESVLSEVLDRTNDYREKREAKAEEKRRLDEARALVAEADAKKKGSEAHVDDAAESDSDDEGDQSGEGDRLPS
jgi:hypothetical protein